MSLEELVREGPNYVELQVYVKPESNETKLVLEGGELVFYTEEPPVAGRANASLIKYLAKALKIPAQRIEIVRGVRDRTKTVRIYEVAKDRALEALKKILGEAGQ